MTRKRPGTLGVCALLQNKFRVDAVPHVLCEGFTREETEDFLIELHYLGIDNVFAVRGDSSGYEKLLQHGRTRNVYATDLVTQIAAMNSGRFLEETIDASPTDFCVGVAAYPEKHVEAPNLRADVARVKQKVDLGAEYIVTQMFFDNRHYFAIVEECRAQGIVVPIIPGLKVLTSPNQVKALPATFHCDIPAALADAVEKDPDHARDIGIAWAIEQGRAIARRRRAVDALLRDEQLRRRRSGPGSDPRVGHSPQDPPPRISVTMSPAPPPVSAPRTSW